MKTTLVVIVFVLSLILVGCSTNQGDYVSRSGQQPLSIPTQPKPSVPPPPSIARPGSWPIRVQDFGSFDMQIDSSGTTITRFANVKVDIRKNKSSEPTQLGWNQISSDERVYAEVRHLEGCRINPEDRRFSMTQETGKQEFLCYKFTISGQFAPDGETASGTWEVLTEGKRYSCSWQAKWR